MELDDTVLSRSFDVNYDEFDLDGLVGPSRSTSSYLTTNPFSPSAPIDLRLSQPICTNSQRFNLVDKPDDLAPETSLTSLAEDPSYINPCDSHASSSLELVQFVSQPSFALSLRVRPSRLECHPAKIDSIDSLTTDSCKLRRYLHVPKLCVLIIRTRRAPRGRLEGPNRYGRAGCKRCGQCRKHRQKVIPAKRKQSDDGSVHMMTRYRLAAYAQRRD